MKWRKLTEKNCSICKLRSKWSCKYHRPPNVWTGESAGPLWRCVCHGLPEGG